MASTYSTNLAIELIGTGDQAGSWGNTTNTNLGTLIEQAISGYVTQAMTTGNTTTITIPNGATGVARNMYIEMTGTGGTNTFLVVPANKKLYFIYNNTTGAVTVKVSGQTGVSVASGEKTILVSNGTDIVAATSFINSVSTSSANITTLTGTNLTYTSGTITTFASTSAIISTLTSTSANVTTLNTTSGTITTFGSTSANITTLNTTSGTVATLGSTSANITTLTGTSATITTILDGAGLIRNIPQVTKTAAYTLATTDNGKYISTQSGTITVPNNTFSAGNAVSIYNNSGSDISLTLSTTTAYITGTDTNRTGATLAKRGVCTVLFVNPSACVITGSVT